MCFWCSSCISFNFNFTRNFQNSPLFERSTCFYVTISGNFERFQYYKFETDFLEYENHFQKTGVPFLVESTKIETDHFYRKLPYEKPMLRQIKWWVQNGSITMNKVLSVTTLIFWKFCFSLRTSYKELIWCTNDPNAYICTFCKHLNFIWRSKSLLQFVILFVLPFSIFHNK